MGVGGLGAGFMGSAMGCVARRHGHEVRLWGTWLDDSLLDACERGEPHPRLRVPLGGVALFRGAQLASALEGAELVVHAVNSDGPVAVMTKAAAHLPPVSVLSVTKGLLESPRTGKMERINVVVGEHVRMPIRFVHAGGPAKAIEIARGVLTWMQFAGPAVDVALCARAFGDEHLFVSTSADLAGAQLCSALKNADATGLGLWDGFVGADGHNARAACFTPALLEMRTLVVAGGGSAEAVEGPAGVGDLHVTAAAGRNRAFGEGAGQGRPASQVAAEMDAAVQFPEGHAAIAAGLRFAR